MRALLAAKVWVIAAGCGGAALQAQAVKEYDFHLDNGAEVLYQTYGQADANLGTARAFGNMIERNVMDERANTRQLGFRLQIEKLPGDPVRFRVSMGGPLNDSGVLWGFFGRSAPPREIQRRRPGNAGCHGRNSHPGERSPTRFKWGSASECTPCAGDKDHSEAAAGGRAVIHLQGPDFLAGDVALGEKLVRSEAVTRFACECPARGIFSFSTHQEPGYRMEAVAEGNVLMFVTGSDRYAASSAPARSWTARVRSICGSGMTTP